MYQRNRTGIRRKTEVKALEASNSYLRQEQDWIIEALRNAIPVIFIE
jgi:hypothetical protein